MLERNDKMPPSPNKADRDGSYRTTRQAPRQVDKKSRVGREQVGIDHALICLLLSIYLLFICSR